MADTTDMVKDEAVVQDVATSPKKNKKKFDKNSIAWCVGILVIIAVVAGVLLGAINVVTYVDPDQAIMNDIAKAYVVEGSVSKNAGYVVNSNEVNGSVNSAFAFKSGGKDMVAYYAIGKGAYGGSVSFVFYVDINAGIIDKVSVYSSGETASIGGKVLKEDNLSAVVGINLAEITDYGKAGSNDAKSTGYYISGATVTSKGVTNAIRAVAYAYNNTAIE